MHGEQEQDVVNGETLAPVWAVPRGRIFWRLTAPSRRMEVVSVAGDQPAQRQAHVPVATVQDGFHVVHAVAGGGGARLQGPDRCCQSLRDAQSGRESRPGAGEQPGIIARSACWSGFEARALHVMVTERPDM